MKLSIIRKWCYNCNELVMQHIFHMRIVKQSLKKLSAYYVKKKYSIIIINRIKPGLQKIFRGQPNISVGQPILVQLKYNPT